jgi:hypothetical protein
MFADIAPCLDLKVHGYAIMENTRGRRTLKGRIGDTKRGTLIGMDNYGNKFFENLEEELPRM